MINVLKKLFRFSKHVFLYLYYNSRYIRKKYTIKKGAFAIINIDHHIKSDERSVYFYMICRYFEHAGFKVIIKTSWRDFRHFKHEDFKRNILRQKYILVNNCDAPLNTVVLVQPNKANHTIHLSHGYRIIDSGKFDCLANYPMNPLIYKFILDPASLPDAKNSDRAMRILFAGGTNKVKYANKKIETFFNVIPRLEVVKFILTNFDQTIKLHNGFDTLRLKELLSSQEYINNIVINEVRTDESEWLKLLSKTDFFICPPGVRIPQCHNSVEAMSMGAIPILEYSNLFSPPLQHLKNCLHYTNFAELKTAIEKALTMDQSGIEDMRKNVLNYYNNHLSIDGIAGKIKTFANSSRHEMHAAIPFIATSEEWKAYSKACGAFFKGPKNKYATVVD